VISTRTRVISTRKVQFSPEQLWFYTKSVISTHKSAILTLMSVITTRWFIHAECNFYTQSVISTQRVWIQHARIKNERVLGRFVGLVWMHFTWLLLFSLLGFTELSLLIAYFYCVFALIFVDAGLDQPWSWPDVVHLPIVELLLI
jgi:hypothetical protein